MKKAGPMLLDPAHEKMPYSAKNREKRTYVIAAARTSSGDVLLNARSLC